METFQVVTATSYTHQILHIAGEMFMNDDHCTNLKIPLKWWPQEETKIVETKIIGIFPHFSDHLINIHEYANE